MADDRKLEPYRSTDFEKGPDLNERQAKDKGRLGATLDAAVNGTSVAPPVERRESEQVKKSAPGLDFTPPGPGKTAMAREKHESETAKDKAGFAAYVDAVKKECEARSKSQNNVKSNETEKHNQGRDK